MAAKIPCVQFVSLYVVMVVAARAGARREAETASENISMAISVESGKECDVQMVTLAAVRLKYKLSARDAHCRKGQCPRTAQSQASDDVAGILTLHSFLPGWQEERVSGLCTHSLTSKHAASVRWKRSLRKGPGAVCQEWSGPCPSSWIGRERTYLESSNTRTPFDQLVRT